MTGCWLPERQDTSSPGWTRRSTIGWSRLAEKPVEIQALWYNALRLMIQWGSQLGAKTDLWLQMAEQAEASFHQRYWIKSGRYLFDVVDGEKGDDPSLRPNQIFSLSLSHPILRPERWRSVVDIVSERLLTPFGLRTLASDHPDYKPTYSGDLRARDAAYYPGDRMAVAHWSLY